MNAPFNTGIAAVMGLCLLGGCVTTDQDPTYALFGIEETNRPNTAAAGALTAGGACAIAAALLGSDVRTVAIAGGACGAAGGIYGAKADQGRSAYEREMRGYVDRQNNANLLIAQCEADAKRFERSIATMNAQMASLRAQNASNREIIAQAAKNREAIALKQALIEDQVTQLRSNIRLTQSEIDVINQQLASTPNDAVLMKTKGILVKRQNDLTASIQRLNGVHDQFEVQEQDMLAQARVGG